jgi:hypothetical protein
MRLTIPRAVRVSDVLLIIVGALIALSLVGQCAKYLYGHTMLKGFVPTFYVDLETSAPTWYSSAALGLAGALLALIAAAKFKMSDGYRWHWALLACLFFSLSLDEIAMIHELPIDPLRERWGAGGLLYYAWVVPGAALVGLVGILYLRFFLKLPRRTQIGFLLAAMLFVGGAIGVEMLSGAHADAFGEENLQYALIVTIEEFLEMLGIVVFIRALLEYIQTNLGGLQVEFAANAPA